MRLFDIAKPISSSIESRKKVSSSDTSSSTAEPQTTSGEQTSGNQLTVHTDNMTAAASTVAAVSPSVTSSAAAATTAASKGQCRIIYNLALRSQTGQSYWYSLVAIIVFIADNFGTS